MERKKATTLLVLWTIFVAVVVYLGIGFAGGVTNAFEGNFLGVAFTVSPLLLFLIWRLNRQN